MIILGRKDEHLHTDTQTDRWMDGRTDGWKFEWMDWWVDEWMRGFLYMKS